MDVSSLIVDNFLVLYKRCGLDTDFKEKLVPGSEVISHEIIGLSECTLYEVRVAACTSKLRGGCSAPAMIRTGGNVISLSFTVIGFFLSTFHPFVKHFFSARCFVLIKEL